MGNQTTAANVAAFAPFGVLLETLIAYFFPDFSEKLPGGTITGCLMALLAYAVPGSGPDPRIPASLIVAVGTGWLMAGCSALAPTYKKTVTARGTETVEFAGGQYAFWDRLPGEDQQHEATAVTGLGLRELQIGSLMRDVTRNPVSEQPLHGVGFRRTQAVGTAIGDSIEADITSGAAFELEESEDATTQE